MFQNVHLGGKFNKKGVKAILWPEDMCPGLPKGFIKNHQSYG